MGVIAHPSRVGDLARTGAGAATAFGRLVLRWPDAKTILKGPLGIPKRTAWSGPIPLQEVKDVGRALGGTVNDILVTAVTGALRRYLQVRGQEVDDLAFRAVVPVNLRRPGTEADLGNKFGLVFLSLPVGIADPVQRLRELKRRMDALKDSLEPPVAFGILTAIGMSPEPIQDIVVDMFGAKGTAVITNVVGPKERIFLAGAPLEGFMFWVPQAGRLGLGVSILSYAGQVRVGVITDEGLVPDPDVIIEALQSEFDELQDRAEWVEEVPSLEEVAARLDEALAAVDALLEARGGGSTE
jgi:WS/DGAT/MGAT family acyltransferase